MNAFSVSLILAVVVVGFIGDLDAISSAKPHGGYFPREEDEGIGLEFLFNWPFVFCCCSFWRHSRGMGNGHGRWIGCRSVYRQGNAMSIKLEEVDGVRGVFLC